ncbi:MAG: glucose 1-dehydrogenase [Dehalococcoidia bacterium]|jgi:NAD(P)-dependent dehydrogenase (short-subunit alcohol dehydrogenase family)
MEISLKNKVAMITGASRGIGRAIAIEMAKSGADVVLASRKIADLEKVAREIRALGVKAVPVAAHIGRQEDITVLVSKAVEEFGRIDILVNNAATNPTMDSAIDVSERAWDSTMNLNLKGLFFLSQAVARVMKEHGGGVIINVSSIAGVTPDILPIYSVSKAGVNMATKVMAQQWACYGIRTNTLSPGQTKTQFSQALWGNPEIYKYIMARTPLKRIGEPEDMARAAVFLASNEAGFITGQNLIVDGGMTI